MLPDLHTGFLKNCHCFSEIQTQLSILYFNLMNMVTLQHGQGDVPTWSMLWVTAVLIKGPEPTSRASVSGPFLPGPTSLLGMELFQEAGYSYKDIPHREVGKGGSGPQARGLHLYFCACPPMPGVDLPATLQSCAVCTQILHLLLRKHPSRTVESYHLP